MSIWGKVIGGVAGFTLGGPISALLGAVAGHVFDIRHDRAEADHAKEDATKQIAFTIAVIALGAKMAKADGTVTADEVRAFKEVFHVPAEEMQNVARVFDLARSDVHGYEAYARQVAKLFRDEPQVLEDLLDGLFHIAKADHTVHPEELVYLANVARIFGLEESEFARIREAHLGPDKADAYQILGVGRDANNDKIKAAYRRLIREHHPDRLMAGGMPAEFVAVANQKLATINVAYERICRERGIK
ncbi:MAG: molecular chaperone DjiA [Alphaproteobacteria bacterium]|nr:molecular chaperone DjiA [Alphaproteobacteria bacterium]